MSIVWNLEKEYCQKYFDHGHKKNAGNSLHRMKYLKMWKNILNFKFKIKFWCYRNNYLLRSTIISHSATNLQWVIDWVETALVASVYRTLILYMRWNVRKNVCMDLVIRWMKKIILITLIIINVVVVVFIVTVISIVIIPNNTRALQQQRYLQKITNNSVRLGFFDCIIKGYMAFIHFFCFLYCVTNT